MSPLKLLIMPAFPISGPMLIFCVTEGQVLSVMYKCEIPCKTDPQALTVAPKCYCNPNKMYGSNHISSLNSNPNCAAPATVKLKPFMFRRWLRHYKCLFIPNWKREPSLWSIMLNGCSKIFCFRNIEMIVSQFLVWLSCLDVYII